MADPPPRLTDHAGYVNPLKSGEGEKLPDCFFRQVALGLKPHEIGNFQQAINLKPGQHDYYTMKAIQRKKMARLAADVGKPLSEGAKYFFSNECDAHPSQIFDQMNDYVTSVEEATGKQLHLVEVIFDVDGSYACAHPDDTGCMLLDVFGLVKEEVDVLSKYKMWVAEGRKTRAKGTLRECCSGQYHVVCPGTSYYVDGDGFYDFEKFSEFCHSFYNQKEWTEDDDWDCPFSVTADGIVRQRKFMKTTSGRITFPLVNGTPYDPVDFPFPEEKDDWEDFLQKHDADVAEKRKEFEEKQKQMKNSKSSLVVQS